MKLIEDWKRVLRRAWSIRLIVLAGVLSGLEFGLPFLDGFVTIPRGLFAVLTTAATVGACIARLVAQRSVHAD